MTLILAVDGGGTSCRAAVANRGGVILGRAVSGPANVSTDPEGAATNIVEATRAALADAGEKDIALASLPAFLGLAGANLTSAVEAVRAHLPFKECVVEDDAGIALQGALGEMDGAVVVLGTGTVLLAVEAGRSSAPEAGVSPSAIRAAAPGSDKIYCRRRCWPTTRFGRRRR